MTGYRTPEVAVRADHQVPSRYVTIVAVEHSPSGSHAVVCVNDNEAPDFEPYVVLCEKLSEGWIESRGLSGGGLSWMSASEDGSLGVEIIWGDPPIVRWDEPS